MTLTELKAERAQLKQQAESLDAELSERRTEVQKRVDEIWAEFKQANGELIEAASDAQAKFDAKDAELRAAVLRLGRAVIRESCWRRAFCQGDEQAGL